jgi:hypothetical protein
MCIRDSVGSEMCIRDSRGADVLEVKAHAAEDVDGDAFTQLDEAKQDVLGPHVIVVEATGLGPGELDDLAGAGREIVILVLVHGGSG